MIRVGGIEKGDAMIYTTAFVCVLLGVGTCWMIGDIPASVGGFAVGLGLMLGVIEWDRRRARQ